MSHDISLLRVALASLSQHTRCPIIPFFQSASARWPVGVVAIRRKVLSHMYSLSHQLVSPFCVCNLNRPGYFTLLPEVTPTSPWFAVFISHNTKAAYHFIKLFHFCCLPVACRHVATQFTRHPPSQLCAKVRVLFHFPKSNFIHSATSPGPNEDFDSYAYIESNLLSSQKEILQSLQALQWVVARFLNKI